jgi:hypothetical protein
MKPLKFRSVTELEKAFDDAIKECLERRRLEHEEHMRIIKRRMPWLLLLSALAIWEELTMTIGKTVVRFFGGNVP